MKTTFFWGGCREATDSTSVNNQMVQNEHHTTCHPPTIQSFRVIFRWRGHGHPFRVCYSSLKTSQQQVHYHHFKHLERVMFKIHPKKWTLIAKSCSFIWFPCVNPWHNPGVWSQETPSMMRTIGRCFQHPWFPGWFTGTSRWNYETWRYSSWQLISPNKKISTVIWNHGGAAQKKAACLPFTGVYKFFFGSACSLDFWKMHPNPHNKKTPQWRRLPDDLIIGNRTHVEETVKNMSHYCWWLKSC